MAERSIFPGISYNFDAREVVDLLIEHGGLSEQDAVAAVELYARPKIIADLWEQAKDYTDEAERCTKEAERMTRLLTTRAAP